MSQDLAVVDAIGVFVHLDRLGAPAASALGVGFAYGATGHDEGQGEGCDAIDAFHDDCSFIKNVRGDWARSDYRLGPLPMIWHGITQGPCQR